MNYNERYLRHPVLYAFFLGLLVLPGAYVTHARVDVSVLDREPIRVQSDDMRILRGQELKKHWRKTFQKAKERIVITTYATSDPKFTGIFTRVVEPLKNAVKRGVDVRLIIPDHLDRNQKLAPKFEDVGIDVKLHSGPKLMHSKIVLVDNDQVYGGSTNFTVTALARDSETMIWMENRSLNQKLSSYVSNQLWKN